LQASSALFGSQSRFCQAFFEEPQEDIHVTDESDQQKHHGMTRRDTVLCGALLTIFVVGAGVEATVNRRLENPEKLLECAARLKRIPETIGDWTSVPMEIDEREQRAAGIVGFIRREYRHQKTGQSVTLTVLNGSAGPMSVHPPTACFEGVGYSLIAGPSVVSVQGRSEQTVQLNRAIFHQGEGIASDSLRAFWGWSTDGQWDAPANPRLSYRGEPSLYKIYAIDRASAGEQQGSGSEEFLAEAIPVMRRILSPDGSAVADSR
jgi:hypothetical protein